MAALVTGAAVRVRLHAAQAPSKLVAPPPPVLLDDSDLDSVEAELLKDERHAAWRQHRLERELRYLGLGLDVLTPGQPLYVLAQPAQPAVRAFLEPQGPEALAVSRVPGRARMVAATLAAVLQRARARDATELRNYDRTSEELLQEPPGPPAPLVVVLDGLPAAEVGCLLRTCEAARVREVLICGDTPGPPDPQVLKTSLKAEEHVPHRRARSILEALGKLRAEGHQLWDLRTGTAAGDDDAVFLELCSDGPVPPQPLALILGSRCQGDVAAHCDVQVRLPGNGDLSTGVAGSVAVYDILRRWES